jgi:hypothetical protein
MHTWHRTVEAIIGLLKPTTFSPFSESHQTSGIMVRINTLFFRTRVNSIVFVNSILFNLRISATPESLPEGYLFLCPVQDLQPRPGSFQSPESPAYWSTDPSGTERLSTKEATDLGFPTIELTMDVCGYSWDGSVYAGLRTFHRGKGFDPDALEVARHLDFPLFQLSSDVEPLFAHGKHNLSFTRNTNIFTVDGKHDEGVNPVSDNRKALLESVANDPGERKFCIQIPVPNYN